MTTGSYRPRNPGHDYYGRGVYLVTLVVRERLPLLGSLDNAALHLSPLGEEVLRAWEQIPVRQEAHGNRVVVHASVCMPDNFHGVIEVLDPMQWSLGDILQAFKAHCTKVWQERQGLLSSSLRPISVAGDNMPSWLLEKTAAHPTEGSLVRNLSKIQRQEYYALVGRDQRPLFDDSYDDTVCLDERHRAAMIAYVRDNPRRALLRRRLPDFMQRCLHILVGDRSYGAFGNLFLLRWANKVQVYCHRRHPATGEPYEITADYASQRDEWIAAVLGGGTVIVTPGISRGEMITKNECLEKGYPLIHLQKEPIGRYWKPERRRFEACANGSLLILAPWNLDQMQPVAGVPPESDYSRFHNLNAIAAELCTFSGSAKVVE